MPNIKILVCAHKKDYVRQDDVYMPIQVGKAISGFDLGFQGDDTGDNISDRNDWYAELTAMYWAWKNLKGVDYIGLCHYRRYFVMRKSSLFLPSIISVSVKDYVDKKDTKVDIEFLMNNIDVIVPKSGVYATPLYMQYGLEHSLEDLSILWAIIKLKYPEYREAFDKVMLHSNTAYGCNMFVMRWKLFNEYCTWLFPLLQESSEYIKRIPYSYQKRTLGFLAERLFEVYCEHWNLKTKQCSVYLLGDKAIQQKYAFLKDLKIRVLNHVKFFFANLGRNNKSLDLQYVLDRSNIVIK